MSETLTKTHKQRALEVHTNNTNHGWFNEDRTFGEMMALLHSEVSEALEAYRNWKLEDATHQIDRGPGAVERYPLPKPEGVGSEFADIYIRLLDDCQRLGINLEEAVNLCHGCRRFGIHDRFAENINTLHTLIARAVMIYDTEVSIVGTDAFGRELAAIYIFLMQLCDLYEIDLFAEYERKMAYNRTRPWRHGGKTL